MGAALKSIEPEAGHSGHLADALGDVDVSHNLNGQKLGRKGQATRERILSAAAEVIAEGSEVPISLSAVARKANLGMTSLYLYFTDLTELLLAVLRPVMEDATDGYFRELSEYWPDEELEERCRSFVQAYFDFWTKHSRVLHLRNNMADQYDERMMMARVRTAQPTIALLRKQMALPGGQPSAEAGNMASVLMTGLERAVTVATDTITPAMIERAFGPRNTNVVEPLTRLFVLAVRDCRQQAG
ncbi:TetR/AcrR family transcriptional regulator [Novosphingobium aquae]|uniref:TetR/AcrR family transcriptional regulator n=1 Tax=Novosphingobium aquae TaxID=3133435 RepID=A0ABU8S820_9SPHN